MRAVQPLDARHPPHERLHRFHHDRIGRGRCQRRTRGGEVGGLVRGPQQTVVADALEAIGQHVLHEAPDELGRVKAHHLLAVAVGRITHPEAHMVPLHAEDALVGNRHPVRVTPEILQHLRRATQRLFGIHHPVVTAHSGNERAP